MLGNIKYKSSSLCLSLKLIAPTPVCPKLLQYNSVYSTASNDWPSGNTFTANIRKSKTKSSEKAQPGDRPNYFIENY